MKPDIYHDLIIAYKEMCDDVIINTPEYCKGDQEILSSSMNIRGYSYSRGCSNGDCSIQYNGGLKTQMI